MKSDTHSTVAAEHYRSEERRLTITELLVQKYIKTQKTLERFLRVVDDLEAISLFKRQII